VHWATVDVALWLVFFVVWIVAAFFSRKTVRKESPSSRLRYALFSALAVALIHPRVSLPWLDALDPRETLRTGPWRVVPPWLGFVSVALTASGIAFAFWARYTLGRNWSGTVTLKEGHTLVQNGPYALARHPIYTGLIVAFLGTFLGVGVSIPRMVLGMTALILGLRLKMETEERFMSEHFGQAYAAYRQRVKGLIPFLW
jgi:protein-S-isoprenylcysteine O-methyltransferase Ste14